MDKLFVTKLIERLQGGEEIMPDDLEYTFTDVTAFLAYKTAQGEKLTQFESYVILRLTGELIRRQMILRNDPIAN